MILVDTSVFIDYLKGKNNNSTQNLEYILESKIPYGINDFIYQEILQGAKDRKEFSLLKKYFETIPFYYLQNGKESYEKASMLHVVCKQKGITIRSTIDLLIAETAIENDLYLLHNDNDFQLMSKVVKNLKIYEERFYWEGRGFNSLRNERGGCRIKESGMEAKLTIKLEKSVIQSAKKYAENNNKSLSKLVEDYLRKLISEDEPQKQYSPLVEELSGVISEKDLKNIELINGWHQFPCSLTAFSQIYIIDYSIIYAVFFISLDIYTQFALLVSWRNKLKLR